MAPARNTLHQPTDDRTFVGMLNARKILQQLVHSPVFATVFKRWDTMRWLEAFKEIGYSDTRYASDFVKPTGAHAICARFVFLHLLIGHLESVCKITLGQFHGGPPFAYPCTDVGIDVSGYALQMTIYALSCDINNFS